MSLKKFLKKLKVSAYGDALFIAALSLILLTLGFTMDWCESVVDLLYKYKQYPFDDIIMSFAVVGIFITWFAIKRNHEKKAIIEKQRQIEASLQQTQDNLQLLLNSSASIIFNASTSEGNPTLFMSENITTILGYEKEEYLKLGFWINNIHPEDQPGVYATFPTLYSTGHSGFDYRFKHKNGNWMWMHSTAQLKYDEQGKPIEIIGTWWDISEQKAAEETIRLNNERVQMAFQATRDAIYDWDLSSREVWMSNEIYRSFGYDKETTRLSFDWWQDKIHPEDRDSINGRLKQLLENKNINWSNEYRFRRADGSYANVLSRGFVIYSNDGKPVRLVGAMADLTVLKQTEAELILAKNKAEESVKFKGEFLANMSHEIRTPLNGIIGMTELALQTEVNPQQKRYLENIQFSSETLLSLVNDILDFSKIDAGKLELSPVNFSMRDEIPRSLQGLGLKASEKKLEFVFSLDQNIPDLYYGDVFRLQQVILNLAGNAIKFTEKGEVAVKCKLKSLSQAEAILQISVTDTGIGIANDKLSAIFDEFIQADGCTSREYGGTGLGLAISKSLVEMMGGTIWAESEVGKGSTFYFTIRMQLQDVQNKPRFVPGTALDGKRVLIVEDNKATRTYTLQLINQFRMRGFAVATGESALLELNKAVQYNDPYQLVLLDINLSSQMNGFDVAEAIKNDPTLQTTNIIVISMSQKASDRERFGQMGITQFFSKPFSQSDLLDTIQNIFLASAHVYNKQPLMPEKLNNESEFVEGPLKILLVEDNIINQEVACSMLTSLGHTITIAHNGLEALELFQQETFDIILMDVQMPKMNGYEATIKIREIEKQTGTHTYIIGLTANAMKGDKEKCLEKGMDDYVSKPIRMNDMTKAITRFTQREQADMNKRVEKKTDEKPLVNLQGVLQNFNNNEEIFEHFMSKIPEHLEASLESLRLAIESAISEDIAYAAHSLRGLCMHFDMYKVIGITTEMEELANENRLHEVISLHPTLTQQLKAALVCIKERKGLVMETA